MPNAIVKNVLASIFLVVLCFILGAQAAEDGKISIGIVVAIVAAVFLLWVGPRSWVLIYLLPPVLVFAPMPGKLAELPMAFLIAAPVLGYWIVMYVMGYTRFRWRGLAFMDITLLVFFIYFVSTYIRHPVSLGVFGIDAEYIGGKEYVWFVLAYIYYFAVSVIPCTYEQVCKVLKWAVVLQVGACILFIILALCGVYGGGISELAESASSSRFSLFSQLGIYGVIYVYGLYSLSSILMSPGKLIGCLLSMVAIVFSGWREMIASNCFVIAGISIIKRELWCLTILGLLFYGGLLFISSEGVLKELPYGMQRSMAVIPGLEIQESVRRETNSSSEWRVVMWKWALDSRTGYIKDYIWGDGFGQSTEHMRRETTSIMRGTTRFGSQEFFAQTGVWHSGYITSIHRIGYVGLALIVIVYLVGLYTVWRVCSVLKGTPLYIPALLLLTPYFGAPFQFFVSAGTFPKFFATFVALSMAKLLFCVAREQRLLIPFIERQKYVPEMIRAHEERVRPSA